MVDVAAGATAMPPSVTINLTTLLATSMLGEAGGLGPFPNQAAIEKNARNQQDASLLGGFLPGRNSSDSAWKSASPSYDDTGWASRTFHHDRQ